MSERRALVLLYTCALGTVGALLLTSSWKKVSDQQQKALEQAAEQDPRGASKPPRSTFDEKLASLDKVR